VVDETQVDSSRSVTILPELARLRADLIADGYMVEQRLVPRVDVPRTADNSRLNDWKNAVSSTKNVIRSVYDADPDTLKSVLLIGHVPVPYSGDDADDGHTSSAPPDHRGAWPADIYYGVMDDESVWTDTLRDRINLDYPENSNIPGDGKFDQDELPDGVDVDIAIGRVDLHNLAYFTSNSTSGLDKETTLLKRYLTKNHEFRSGQWSVKEQALVDDNFGSSSDENNALRLAPLVGRENIIEGEFDTRSQPDYTGPSLTNDTWLFAYGSGIGTRATISDTIHIADYAYGDRGPHQGVFNMLFGSYAGDWDKPWVLRGPIADPDGLGLAVTWGSRPDWFFHPMGLGGTLGNSTILTQNQGTTALYPSTGSGNGGYSRDTQTALLGDPTLRLHYFEPASNVRADAQRDSDAVEVSWTASPASGVLGYHVYRANSLDGDFARLNTDLVAGTSFTDPAGGDQFVYMVRPMRLETTPSGSYYNLATGTFSDAVLSLGSFGYETSPNTITLTFSEDVTTLDASDLVIAKTDGTMTLNPGDYTVSYDAATRQAVVTITGGIVNPMSGVAGVLPDGVWSVTVSRDASDDVAHDGIASGFFSFVSLTADANGDGIVDLADFTIVRNNFGSMFDSPTDGDFNFDGVVNLADFTLLRNQFGEQLIVTGGV
jgi:hypothetical protein